MSTEHSGILGADDVPAIEGSSNSFSFVNSQRKDFASNLSSPSEDKMFVCRTLTVEEENTSLNNLADNSFPLNFSHGVEVSLDKAVSAPSSNNADSLFNQSIKDFSTAHVVHEDTQELSIVIEKIEYNIDAESVSVIEAPLNSFISNNNQRKDFATTLLNPDEDRTFACMISSVDEDSTSLNNLAEHTDNNFFPLNFSHKDTTPVIASSDCISDESLCKNLQSSVNSVPDWRENFRNNGRNIDPYTESASKFINYSSPSLESFPSNNSGQFTSDCSNQVISNNSDHTPNFEISLDGEMGAPPRSNAASSDDTTRQSAKNFNTERSVDEDIQDLFAVLEKMADYNFSNFSYYYL